jgi:uncharacterized protein (TIGR03067 family)
MGLVLAGGLLINVDADAANKKELARFEGTWRFDLVEVDGEKRPKAPFKTNKLIISRDGNYIVVQGKTITRGVMRLDLTKTPKQMDSTISNGPNKGKTFAMIYELNGDTYKLCGSYLGKERPAAFESKAKSGLIFQILKREKQPVKDALIEVGRTELAGNWQAVSYALNGKKASAKDMEKIQLTFDPDGKSQARRDGKVFIASMATIDPTQTPMAIDLKFTEGSDKGKSALGIYKIDDGILTICRAGPGQARPTAFSSKPDSGHTLMTYKRRK